MIIINNTPLDFEEIKKQYDINTIQEKTLNILNISQHIYNYRSIEELKFDLSLKNAMVESARELDKSEMDFKVFTKTRCNYKFWNRMRDGGFVLKEGVSSYDAIRDIFKNGRKYGTECATAIIMVYYGALTKVFPKEVFNKVYTEIELMNWKEVDRRLGLIYYDEISDGLPGDCRYFKNPDVNPKHPEWQGENAIDLGDGKYYGHGVGIEDGETMIKHLNKNRIKGSKQSAYLTEHVTTLNGKYLYNILQQET